MKVVIYNAGKKLERSDGAFLKKVVKGFKNRNINIGKWKKLIRPESTGRIILRNKSNKRRPVSDVILNQVGDIDTKSMSYLINSTP